MPDFLDFMERANTGPMMTEKDFNMKILIPAIRDLLKEYDITLDRENPVSADDALADRLFGAALALLDRTDPRRLRRWCTGYCTGQNRLFPGGDARI
jgi:hypothetical protein